MAGAPMGTVVTADEQSSGRGRQGRPWLAPAGSALLYSAVLTGSGPPDELLSLRAGLAVCDVVEALGAGPARLKWPNDVWLDGLKCAGILVEGRPQTGWSVVGVGINLSIEPDEFGDELRGRATSIGGAASTDRAMVELNRGLERWLASEAGDVLEGLRSRDALLGREIKWNGGAEGEPRGAGTASGIDDRGRLIVRRVDGSESRLNAGEVHLGG